MVIKRGAPDHTVLTEQNFAHYEDMVTLRGSADIASAPAWTDALDVELRGVWGYMWAWANSFDFQVRVTIDDNIVYFLTILQLKGGGFWGAQNPWGKFGCTQYNQVAGELSYGMFIDEKWGIYIHKNLKIEVRWSGGLGSLASWGIYYKELP